MRKNTGLILMCLTAVLLVGCAYSNWTAATGSYQIPGTLSMKKIVEE